MSKPSTPLLTRFWPKVILSEPNKCWLWAASTRTTGYGQMTHKGKSLGAHRVSWELANGEIPHGLHVLHKCDNRLCVNPSHLFLGTHADNMADMRTKGRQYNPKACPQGHSYTQKNSRLVTGYRICIQCRNDRSRKHYLKEGVRERKNELRKLWRAKRREQGLVHV